MPFMRYIVALLLALLGIAGTNDYIDAINMDTAEKEAREARTLAAIGVRQFSHPLAWSATVTQSGPGIREIRTRYYVPSRESK